MPVLALIHRELLLFAGLWLTIGLVDELIVDGIWFGMVVTGRARAARLPAGFSRRPLSGTIAVFVPAWQEAAVIGTTVHHALAVWPQSALRLYIGCYANDHATVAAARHAAAGDPRVRIVIGAVTGPTTKAGCLNVLYQALQDDEARCGIAVRAVVLHDAEDMVHPAELGVFDQALQEAEFVQLPVRAEPLAASRWIAGHYLDEFAEAHTKTMMVRDALRAALPAAGVGCAFARGTLARLAAERCQASAGPELSFGPFTPDSLTEDYEIGWRIARLGGRARFLRLRDETGLLVATRAFFPETLEGAVRQKTRWTHGIAFQGWDRIGWQGGLVDRWMALRDRRAPLAAIALIAAYASLVLGLVLRGAAGPGVPLWPADDPLLRVLLWICLGGLVWRVVLRFVCSAHEYGLGEGLRAVIRVPVANLVEIAAGQRALRAYLRTLRGAPLVWDKTIHRRHPALALRRPDR